MGVTSLEDSCVNERIHHIFLEVPTSVLECKISVRNAS
jgi:hypothetical protein